MPETQTINLISTDTKEYREFPKLTAWLKKAMAVSVGALLVSGLTVGAAYLILTQIDGQLTRERTQLFAAVSQESVKEGLLAAVKDRANKVAGLITGGKNIKSIFAIMKKLAAPEKLQSVALDSDNNILVTANLSTPAEAAAMVDALLTSAQNKETTKPTLKGLTITKDGLYSVSVQFVPGV